MNLYSVLTKNCNLSCRHCHVSAGPGNETSTMPVEDFRKVVKNLGGLYCGSVYITGGEIFTMENHLWGYLEALKEHNDKVPAMDLKIDIGVQTNGFWAKDRRDEILDKLKKYGVNDLDISSNDKFHHEQGFPNIFHELKKAIVDREIEHYTIRGAGKIFAIGRAENLPIPRYYECASTICKGGGLSMNWKGELSRCCYGFFRLNGNLIEEPLSEIIKRNDEREVIKEVREGGIEEVARHEGFSDEKIKEQVKELGTGGFCASLFREGIVEGGRIFN